MTKTHDDLIARGLKLTNSMDRAIKERQADLKREDLDDLIARTRQAIVSLDGINQDQYGGVDVRLSGKAHGAREALGLLIDLRDSGDLNFDATNNPLVAPVLAAQGARRQGLDLILGYMRSYVSL